MFEAGIINGIGGGIFNPRGEATRAEFATRFIEALSGNGTNGTAQGTALNSVDVYFDRRALDALTRALATFGDEDPDNVL